MRSSGSVNIPAGAGLPPTCGRVKLPSGLFRQDTWGETLRTAVWFCFVPTDLAARAGYPLRPIDRLGLGDAGEPVGRVRCDAPTSVPRTLAAIAAVSIVGVEPRAAAALCLSGER